MKLDRVTITGADDSVTAADLIALSAEFPFVEWGILFSRSSHGARPRFPSSSWVTTNIPALGAADVKLCAHLCGGWVRALVLDGDFAWRACYRATGHNYARIQLNFHGEFHRQHPTFARVIEMDGRQFILQCDSVNDDAVKVLCHSEANTRERTFAVPLFDTSGGAGVLPDGWPAHWGPGIYCGYAGGLSPSNVLQQLELIEKAAPGPQPIWIDMERQVRTPDDSALDLTKVRSVLEQVAPFVSR